jgi:hypothetical protein
MHWCFRYFKLIWFHSWTANLAKSQVTYNMGRGSNQNIGWFGSLLKPIWTNSWAHTLHDLGLKRNLTLIKFNTVAVLLIAVVAAIWVNRWPEKNESESRYQRHLNQFIFPHWPALHESRRTRTASSVFTLVIHSHPPSCSVTLRPLLQWRCPRRRRPTPPASTPVLPPALPPHSGQTSYPLLRSPEPY